MKSIKCYKFYQISPAYRGFFPDYIDGDDWVFEIPPGEPIPYFVEFMRDTEMIVHTLAHGMKIVVCAGW